MEDAMARLEAEVARGKQALEDQLRVTHEICESGAGRFEDPEQLQLLQEHARQLERANKDLEAQRRKSDEERDEAQRRLQASIILIHRIRTEMEALKSDVVCEAIKRKIM